MRVWFAAAFNKNGLQTIHHWVRVEGLSHELIRDVWAVPEDEPVYGVYPITHQNIDRIQPFVPDKMDLEAYTWQLLHEAEGHEPD
jgi:hypothetical protein